MDLMYGCASDYDLSLQEQMEFDLKAEMGLLTGCGNKNDLISDFETPPLLFDEGFDELGMKLESSESDIFGMTPFEFGLAPIVTVTNAKVNSPSNNSSRTNSKKENARLSAKLVKSISSLNKRANGDIQLNGLGLEDSFGVMVDPFSIVPVSVSSSAASSIGSETDPECFPTDDESEGEIVNGSITAWIVPNNDQASRSPSPVEPEPQGKEVMELDEPEFILSGPEPEVEGPPVKKRKQKHEPQPHTDGKIYPKPAFSYSCLIAMSLKNSKTGSLPVSEIYKFMCDHFPYFKSAPSGWKNSVRHNLSLNKCFEKVEQPSNGAKKGCLWALNPGKVHKMDEEVQKWLKKDLKSITIAMSDPENLPLIERGELKRDYSGAGASDEDEEEDLSEPSTPLTPAQLQARGSRTSSCDSFSSESALTTTNGNVLTVVAPASVNESLGLQRTMEPKIQLKKDNSVDLGTITSVQGSYLYPNPGTATYTLSFSNIGNTTPIIIRRAPLK